jgi:hypothetical protein
MVQVIEVTQFFSIVNKSWAELTNGQEHGVLPSYKGNTFLWSEKPRLREVTENQTPSVGDVWYMEDNGLPKLYKANYDSSD